MFAASGTVHLVRPQAFAAIMPRAIPGKHHKNLIYLSGLIELVCAVGLFRRKVFPANLQMALDAGSGRNPGATDKRLVAWGRLPLQIPMVWAALQSRPQGQGASPAAT
jgi:uncharacterized membrane protein